jgi:CO/xanthine dehydrogenase FAD-binding subunit
VYLRPDNLAAALAALDGGARPLAGGTDIFVNRPSGDVVDISRLPDLRGVSREGDALRIGATTTWSEIAAADLPPGFTALRQAAREIGALQIQNMGTIGGNLCNASPAADGVPPLLALDAEVELASPAGRRRLKLADFILGVRRTALRPGELLTAIIAPRPEALDASVFLKLGARRTLVISIVMTAVGLAVRDGRVVEARVAVGAASPVARRLPLLEERLRGKPADASLGLFVTADAFDALAPIDDLRAAAGYRRDAAMTLTRRALAACLADLQRAEAA